LSAKRAPYPTLFRSASTATTPRNAGAAPQHFQKPKEMTYTALPGVQDSQMDGQSSVKSSPCVEPLFPFLDLRTQFANIRTEVMRSEEHTTALQSPDH